jgi:MSHA biogenesis protein MshK
MDEAMKRRARQLLAALSAALLLAPASAQVLRDPTQPPAVAAPSAAAGSASSTAEPVSSEPKLQSVLISTRPGGRKVAVIDGTTVRVGDKFHDAIVAKITPTSVVLKQDKQEHTLTLIVSASAKVDALPAAKEK